MEPSITAKYIDGMYKHGYLRGGSNIDLKPLTCKDNIVIPSKLQSYVVHRYHTYLFHPVMDRTEAMIRQHLYWPDIIDAVQKEVISCDIFQRTKLSKQNMVHYQLS